jgi:hypothetical protein
MFLKQNFVGLVMGDKAKRPAILPGALLFVEFFKFVSDLCFVCFWMEQPLARSGCYKSVFVLSTIFIQVPLSSYKLGFLLSTRFLCFS